MSRRHGTRPLIPRFVRMFSVPIVLFWFGLVVVLSVAVPPLEQVSQEHTVSLSPTDAPSMNTCASGTIETTFNSPLPPATSGPRSNFTICELPVATVIRFSCGCIPGALT